MVFPESFRKTEQVEKHIPAGNDVFDQYRKAEPDKVDRIANRIERSISNMDLEALSRVCQQYNSDAPANDPQSMAKQQDFSKIVSEVGKDLKKYGIDVRLLSDANHGRDPQDPSIIGLGISYADDSGRYDLMVRPHTQSGAFYRGEENLRRNVDAKIAAQHIANAILNHDLDSLDFDPHLYGSKFDLKNRDSSPGNRGKAEVDGPNEIYNQDDVSDLLKFVASYRERLSRTMPRIGWSDLSVQWRREQSKSELKNRD